jgi:phage-related protein
MADKDLVWLHGEIKTPPFSAEGRSRAGHLLRLLQQGNLLGMPDSRPMAVIGPRCHELRVRDPGLGMTWRVIYRIDEDAIVIADVFAKKTTKTPAEAIAAAERRLAHYDACKE